MEAGKPFHYVIGSKCTSQLTIRSPFFFFFAVRDIMAYIWYNNVPNIVSLLLHNLLQFILLSVHPKAASDIPVIVSGHG